MRCGHQCPERRAALDETQEREEHAHDDAVVRLAREPSGTSHRHIVHVVQERECVPGERALAEGAEHQAAVARETRCSFGDEEEQSSPGRRSV